MEDRPNSNGENRNPDGTFAEGNPGGPGRPKGSVSIVAKIKAKFEEDPKYFEEWINKLLEDPSNRKAVMEQIDGKPKQSVELGGKDGAPIETIVGKRFLLALVAILGAVSYSALNGTPLDVNSVTSLGQVAFEAVAAFLAAHGSYSLVTGKTAAQTRG